MVLRAAAFGALLTLQFCASAADAGWPQWRGPSRDGMVAAGARWPERIDDKHLVQRWRVDLGPSYSGPIVAGDRIFTTESHGKKSERVHALDRRTGKSLWQQEWEGSMSVPFFARSNGDWIRSTPAWDGERLYVAGMRDVLVCLNGTDGSVAWRRDFVSELKTPLPAFGFVSSPLVDGDHLYTQAGASVARLDKRTGAIQWRALTDEGGMNGSAFSSPVMATLAGKRQLVVQTRTTLAGLDLDTGSVLWSTPVEAMRGMNILTPLVLPGDLVFTSAYGGRTTAFRITAGDAGALRVGKAWEHKAQGYMTTPLEIQGHLYTHLRSERALCLDVATGAEKWTSSQAFGKYWSLVGLGRDADRFLALDERGILFLLRANPAKLEILDQRKVGDDTWAHLAVVGDEVFIRELKAMAVYDWK